MTQPKNMNPQTAGELQGSVPNRIAKWAAEFVAEFRVMLATDPGDVHGFSFQDQRKIGPYTVAAPWIAEEFPELATHGEDPFIRHLKGEVAFEHPPRERVVRWIMRQYLRVLYLIALGCMIGLPVLIVFRPSALLGWMFGGLAFLIAADYVLGHVLEGWSGISRRRISLMAIPQRLGCWLSHTDEALLPLSPRGRVLVMLRGLAPYRGRLQLIFLCGLAAYSAIVRYNFEVRGMPAVGIASIAFSGWCISVLPIEFRGMSLVLLLVKSRSSWELMRLRLRLLEPDTVGPAPTRSGKPMHVFVASLGMTPLLLYQVSAAFVVYAALTISGRPSGVLPWVLLAVLPFLTPAWIRRIAQGAIRYLARFVIADAIAIQRAKFGGDDVVTFPKTGA